MDQNHDKPPVLGYQRPTPASGIHIARWNRSVATMLVLGSLGALLLVAGFFVSPALSRLLAMTGGLFLIITLVVWQIERNW